MNDFDAIKEMELFRRMFRDGLITIPDPDTVEFGTGRSTLRSVLSAIETDYDKETDKKKQAESAKAYLRHIEAGRRNSYIFDSESQIPELRKCLDQRDHYKDKSETYWNDNVRLLAKVKQLSDELALFDTGKKGAKKND